MTVRDAAAGDADAIAAIYAHHVLNGTATFDTVPPEAAAMAAKVAEVQGAGWPFLVIEQGGELAGYAYATQIRPRPAYAHTAEDSIYIRHDRVGRGLGATLLAALLNRAATAGFEQMVAVIGAADPASIALHTRAGFREAGRLVGVGRKFGRVLDTFYMQRSLGRTD